MKQQKFANLTFFKTKPPKITPTTSTLIGFIKNSEESTTYMTLTTSSVVTTNLTTSYMPDLVEFTKITSEIFDSTSTISNQTKSTTAALLIENATAIFNFSSPVPYN